MNINMSQTDVTGLHNIIIKCVYYTVYQIKTFHKSPKGFDAGSGTTTAYIEALMAISIVRFSFVNLIFYFS